MALDWQRLIKEHHDWESYNFSDVTVEHQLMGVQEEVGELTHHHLKATQNIRNNEDHLREGQDAVGDTVIYLLGVMHSLDMLEGPGQRESAGPGGSDELVLILGHHWGLMLGAVLGHTSGVRYYTLVLVTTLQRYCAAMQWDFEQIVMGTWAKVKQRDWQKDPVLGVSPSDTRAMDLLREDDTGVSPTPSEP